MDIFIYFILPVIIFAIAGLIEWKTGHPMAFFGFCLSSFTALFYWGFYGSIF